MILNSGIIRNTVPLPEGEGQNKGAPMRVPIAGLVLPGNPETLKKLHTPVIYVIGGESDIAYKNAEQDFSEIGAVPVFKANMDTGHNGTYWQPHGGKFAEVATNGFSGNSKATRKRVRCSPGSSVAFAPLRSGRLRARTGNNESEESADAWPL